MRLWTLRYVRTYHRNTLLGTRDQSGLYNYHIVMILVFVATLHIDDVWLYIY